MLVRVVSTVVTRCLGFLLIWLLLMWLLLVSYTSHGVLEPSGQRDGSRRGSRFFSGLDVVLRKEAFLTVVVTTEPPAVFVLFDHFDHFALSQR